MGVLGKILMSFCTCSLVEGSSKVPVHIEAPAFCHDSAMSAKAFDDVVMQDLAEIVDLSYDVLEKNIHALIHPAKCPGLTSASQTCDFIADGANLCAQEHSAHWWNFTVCMYSNAVGCGNEVGGVTRPCTDDGNPLASVDTFDTTMAQCAAQALPDYLLEDMRTCVYGSEAATLRKASNAKTKTGLVWVNVAGGDILAPEGTTVSRSDWAQQVRQAICSAYEGALPSACQAVAAV